MASQTKPNGGDGSRKVAESTYVGGSHALIDQLCATPDLEALRIAPDTRPDHDSHRSP